MEPLWKVLGNIASNHESPDIPNLNPNPNRWNIGGSHGLKQRYVELSHLFTSEDLRQDMRILKKTSDKLFKFLTFDANKWSSSLNTPVPLFSHFHAFLT